MADFFSTLFGGGAQEDAAAKNAAALQQYGGTANAALGTGYNTGVTNLNNAVQAYTPLANLGSQYSQAGNLLLGSLGAGGPQATAAAQGAFQNAPGYTGAVDAGTQAILRQMAGAGMNLSGNTAQDVGTFTQNLQNQQYGNWQTQLANLAGLGAQTTGAAAQGQATGDTGLANLGYQYGSDQSGVAGNIASGTMADNNMVAAGQAAGAKNLLGAGLSLATLAMGGNPMGGAMGGGGGSSLLNLFKGGSLSGGFGTT
jgi:hypothetical protein